MRFVSLIPAVLALSLSGAAHAQWSEYVNRADFFTVNFPDEPKMAEVPYKTAKGTELKAHIYTADAAANSIQSGTYSMTVVDYSSALPDLPTAIQEAAAAIRAKGTPKYDAAGNIDQMASWRMTVETADNRRIMAEILVAANNRLYISQANTSTSAPVPAQFQASMQILDVDGVRIRYRTVGSPERVR
jgi:hypothetical protein